ncbi:hypothetical protein H7Y29_03360 [Microbacteriaceae bacterium]|nr:hypothetical protein [Candidatus Saccharibacteria bacterium]
MKKSDIAMIILIASMTAIIAFAIGNSIPALKPSSAGVKVPTAEKVDSNVVNPDQTVFNKDAINPTVQTVIGGPQSGQ